MQKIGFFFKNNYELILSFFLFGIILIVAINPKGYINATSVGLSVWAEIVLPSLFIFFILTKILIALPKSQKLFLFLDKPFSKIYNVKNYAGYIFIMSIVAGYPIGAKLISEFYEKGLIDKNDAYKMISFCSTSGPMFILGSLASQIFNNNLVGIVVFISHLLASLSNGLFYRNLAIHGSSTAKVPKRTEDKTKTSQTLNSIMYDSIISILMVGGYIALCFAGIELVSNLVSPFFNLLGLNTKLGILSSVFKGIVEVTTGCVSLSKINIGTKTISVILSALVSFGGISIHLQSQMFLKKVNISYKYFLITKATQTILSIIFAILLCNIML